jgi:LysM repeat protein
MTLESNTKPSKICPTCGTRISEDATRCLVCGSDLTINGEKPITSAKTIQGSKMPQVTLSLPAAIGLLAIFLGIGAVMVYFALQRTGRVVPPTPTPTVSITVTPSLTATPPTPTLTYTPLPSPTPLNYTVVQGDTCLAIAAQFEVSVQSIILLNALGSSCVIAPGDQLLIPHPTPTATPFPTATLSGADATLAACETVDYTVEEGDTLSSIATNYAVPMAAIQEYNGLPSTTVYSGLTLTIPLCERAATPGPSPTPTPPPPYPAPSLLLPPDGAPFSSEDNTVTLQWAAVGTLNENEAYEVTVENLTRGEGQKTVEYVFDTKFIVPTTIRPDGNIPHAYRWFVTTVRQTGTDESGESIWTSAGLTSAPRVFTWTGGVEIPTPTP